MISLLAEGDWLLARVRHQDRRVLIEGFTAEEGPESYVVAACLPDPAFLGDAMHGKTCAGLWVTGLGKDGKQCEVYLYHVVDNQDAMRDYGAQCVVWQTAINPVVALGCSQRALGRVPAYSVRKPSTPCRSWICLPGTTPHPGDSPRCQHLKATSRLRRSHICESWRMSGDSRRTVQLSRLGRQHIQATNSRGGTLSVGDTEGGEFTPVELLLVAIAGCTALDVDAITVKRSEPARFLLTCSGHKTKSAHGNHITDIQVDFDVEFPDNEGGRAAADVLEIAIRKSHDRLCTVTRTVELATTVDARLRGESVLQAGSPA